MLFFIRPLNLCMQTTLAQRSFDMMAAAETPSCSRHCGVDIVVEAEVSPSPGCLQIEMAMP